MSEVAKKPWADRRFRPCVKTFRGYLFSVPTRAALVLIFVQMGVLFWRFLTIITVVDKISTIPFSIWSALGSGDSFGATAVDGS